MNIKALVNLALEGRTPDEKIALMCQVTGKQAADYAHLDNGRKSMTAGNVLRGACKDTALAAKLIAAAGLQDLDLDTLPDEPVVVVKAKPSRGYAIPAPVKASRVHEQVDNSNRELTDIAEPGILRVSADVYFNAEVI